MKVYLMCLTVALHPFLAKGYANKVASALRELGQHYDGITACQRVGLSKAQTVDGVLPSKDAFLAVILINMYSNPSCYLSLAKQGDRFNEKLNKELQNNFPRGPESKLWLSVGDLVNKAIELLGLKKVNVVYRGCLNNPDLSRNIFSFQRITSTSSNPRVADMFSGCKTFILIEDARGLDMKKYSHVPDEDEILLQSTNIYSVEKFTKNQTEIGEELNKVLPGLLQVNLFVRLRQIHHKTFIPNWLSKALRMRT